MNIPLNQSPSLIDQSTKTTSSCHCIDKNPSVLFRGHLEVHTKCEKLQVVTVKYQQAPGDAG